jgi:hypothetical protein
VKRYSIDEASKAQAGRLPDVAEGQQEKELDEAVFAAEKGQTEGPIKTQSRIDVPRPRTEVRAGPTAVAGVAWGGDRGIARVDVAVDDGPWQEAHLAEALNEDTWRQWVWEWDATPGRHSVRVRATDEDGATQTADRRMPQPDGATGHHTVILQVT